MVSFGRHILCAAGAFGIMGASVAQADVINLSAGLPASNYSSSSVYAGWTAYNAFNNMGWWDANTYSGWALVNLGSQYEISEVQFAPNIQYGSRVGNQWTGISETRIEEILVGTSLSNMHVVFDQAVASTFEVLQDLTFTPTIGQYVEFVFPSSNSWVGFENAAVLGTTITTGSDTSTPGATVPEPPALALIGVGLLGVAYAGRHRMKGGGCAV